MFPGPIKLSLRLLTIQIISPHATLQQQMHKHQQNRVGNLFEWNDTHFRDGDKFYECVAQIFAQHSNLFKIFSIICCSDAKSRFKGENLLEWANGADGVGVRNNSFFTNYKLDYSRHWRRKFSLPSELIMHLTKSQLLIGSSSQLSDKLIQWNASSVWRWRRSIVGRSPKWHSSGNKRKAASKSIMNNGILLISLCARSISFLNCTLCFCNDSVDRRKSS